MVKEKEYLLSVSVLNRPEVVEKEDSIALLLLRLILKRPGTDPLHPDCGVGIEDYRYAMGRLDELTARIEDQINSYCPFPAGEVSIEITDDHLCNIHITVDGVVYTYDSSQSPVPITIDSVAQG